MARINDRLLIQLVDADPPVVVLLDQSTSDEITVPIADVPKVIHALTYFATEATAHAQQS